MAADPLDQVLRLVSEGRLTAEEAAPILAALDEAPATATPGAGGARAGTAGFGFETSPRPDGAATFSSPGSSDATGGSATSLRIEVKDNGRNVVNLRLPLGVGRFALDRVPGLSGDQVDRVREAMNTGFRGPVLVVDDGDSGVRIVLE